MPEAQLVLMISPKGRETYVAKGDVGSFEAAGFTFPVAETSSPKAETESPEATPRRRGRPRGRPKAETENPPEA